MHSETHKHCMSISTRGGLITSPSLSSSGPVQMTVRDERPQTHTATHTYCQYNLPYSRRTLIYCTPKDKHKQTCRNTHTHTVTGSSGCLRAPAGPCHYPVLYPKHAVLISKLWLADDCMTAADQVPFSPGSQTATQSCPISGSPNTLSY